MSFRNSIYFCHRKEHKNLTRDIPHNTLSMKEERAFLPSFGITHLRASLTIEAALVMPIFLFFIACMIHFLLLISLQSSIQLHLDEAARQIGKRAYVADESEILSLISFNSLTIRAEVLDDSLKRQIESSRIQGGVSGFHTFLSTYDKGSSELDVVATYRYVFPYFPKNIASFDFMQRSFVRAWTGEQLSEAEEGEDDEDGRIVYITPTGNAWHSTPSCNYLDLTIRPVQQENVHLLRNKSGGIYGRCGCVTESSAIVYITDYGILYHSDINCSSLKRTVFAVDISEVGSRHPCKKCAAEEGGD